ncbi:MAG: signal peptidase I [Lachnospiraceae bacterium]|nr:signal peptidase I [Lachnospiraceae bacterium]
MEKAWKSVKDALFWGVFIIAVVMMIFTIISLTTLDQNNRSFFGYKAFIVLSDSMSATDFNAGDVVFTKLVEPSSLKEGDIISYEARNEENYGMVITHKIRKSATNEMGQPGYVTYGTTNNIDDDMVVTYDMIIGKYQWRIPKIGVFFQFLKTIPGYICCILIPFLFLIGYQVLICAKNFKAYRIEQVKEIQLERQQLEAERKETQRLIAELQTLKEQSGEKEEIENGGQENKMECIVE